MALFINHYSHATGQYSSIIHLKIKCSVKLHDELGKNTLTHSVRLVLDPLIPPRFDYMDRHQRFFDLLPWSLCRPKPSRKIWCGTRIPLHRGFWIPTAVVQLHIGVILCLPVVFAVIWIIQVPIPVKPIFGVWNAFRRAILIIFGRMAVDFFDLAVIQYLHSASREVLADKAGGTGDSSENEHAAAPSCVKIDQDALMISSVSEMYCTAVICSFSARDSIWVARRFWLPCHISTKLRTLAIRCNFLSSASVFISMSISVLLESNTWSSAASNLLLARADCLTTTFSRRVSPVVSDCLHPITSRPREQLASTPTLWGMIENMSWATLERSVYFDCDSSCYRHQSVISGNQNVLLISIGSDW